MSASLSKGNFQKRIVGIVGGGPIGLELAIALKQLGITFFLFEKGQIGQMIFLYPPQTHFFSSSEKISLAGIPLQNQDQQKCTREQYLAYLRSLTMTFDIDVNSYEEVIKIEKKENDFHILTNSSIGEQSYYVNYVALATGGTSFPRTLGILGEDLSHVSVKMDDPHKYFLRKVTIIGARNSAVESALRCFHAGAKVTLINKYLQFDAKYWLLPELLARIKNGQIECFYDTETLQITPKSVIIQKRGNSSIFEIEAHFVIKAVGFQANMSLFKELGIDLVTIQERPSFNAKTMETSLTNVFVLGTVTAGSQNHYKVFIENSHQDVLKVAKTLCSRLVIPYRPIKVGSGQEIYSLGILEE